MLEKLEHANYTRYMKDFTLVAYKAYLQAMIGKGYPFYRFDEFMSLNKAPEKFCLLRHDVDRKPYSSLQMAKLENDLGVKSTYYFRAKKSSYNADVIKEIAQLGHEIGYHYESLSDTDGDIPKAIEDFSKNLKMFRNLVPIKTCSMHGRPLKKVDNRDMWKSKENRKYLKEDLNVLGEVYLDIDYSNIAYINDTGRNWTSGKSNRRDKVESNIVADFEHGEELLSYLNASPNPQICFQIHPERWSDSKVEWFVQHCKDGLINSIKYILSVTRG